MFSKSLIAVIFVMASLVTGVAHAATVWWQPSGTSIDMLNVPDSGFTVALFDVADFDAAKVNPLNLLAGANTINFFEIGSDFLAQRDGSTNAITLLGDNQFVLSVSSDGTNWFEPVSWSELGTGLYSITFAGGVVVSTNVSPVPVPAALWLFGAGLLGLVAVARRKNIA